MTYILYYKNPRSLIEGEFKLHGLTPSLSANQIRQQWNKKILVIRNELEANGSQQNFTETGTNNNI